MPKFKSVQHTVTAVQWTGVITPEVRSVFGVASITIKPSADPLYPLLLVPGMMAGESYDAKPGDWVVRIDSECYFDLDVMSDDEFKEAYRPATDSVEVTVAVPIALVMPSGDSHTTDVRVRIRDFAPSPSTLMAVMAQVLPLLRDPASVVAAVSMLCEGASAETMAAIRERLQSMSPAAAVH
jgi:hypothetical protein